MFSIMIIIIWSYRPNISLSGAHSLHTWNSSCCCPNGRNNLMFKVVDQTIPASQSEKTANCSKQEEAALLGHLANFDILGPSKGIIRTRIRILCFNKKLTEHRTTSLNHSAWERLLPEDYEHRDFILNGIKDDFHIIDPDCVSHSVQIGNYTSATVENVRAQVESQILTEIQNGRYRIVD